MKPNPKLLVLVAAIAVAGLGVFVSSGMGGDNSVDGGLTMGADSMSRVIKRLRSSLILPMHRRGPPVNAFVSMFGRDFDIAYAPDDSITVSMRTLPKKPLIYVMKGVQ